MTVREIRTAEDLPRVFWLGKVKTEWPVFVFLSEDEAINWGERYDSEQIIMWKIYDFYKIECEVVPLTPQRTLLKEK